MRENFCWTVKLSKWNNLRESILKLFCASVLIISIEANVTGNTGVHKCRSGHWRCSVKKEVFLEISQNSQENICAKDSFLKTLQTLGLFTFLAVTKVHSNTFLIMSQNFNYEILGLLTFTNQLSMPVSCYYVTYCMPIKRRTGISGRWTQELDSVLWTLDSGLWILGAGLWTLDSGG